MYDARTTISRLTRLAIEQEEKNARIGKALWQVYPTPEGAQKKNYGSDFAEVIPGFDASQGNRIEKLKDDALVQRILSAPEGNRGTLDIMSSRGYMAEIATLTDKCVYNGLMSPFSGQPEYESQLETDQDRGLFAVLTNAYGPEFVQKLQEVMTKESIEGFSFIIIRPAGPLSTENFDQDAFRTFFLDQIYKILPFLKVGGEMYIQLPVQIFGGVRQKMFDEEESHSTDEDTVQLNKRRLQILLALKGCRITFSQKLPTARIDKVR